MGVWIPEVPGFATILWVSGFLDDSVGVWIPCWICDDSVGVWIPWVSGFLTAEEKERHADPARDRSDQCADDERFADRNRELRAPDVLQAKELAQRSYQSQELDRNPDLRPSLSRPFCLHECETSLATEPAHFRLSDPHYKSIRIAGVSIVCAVSHPPFGPQKFSQQKKLRRLLKRTLPENRVI